MFSTSDTIAAIATPAGRGGIGVIRVSGPAAHEVVRRLVTHERTFEPRHATLTLIRDTHSPAAGAQSRSSKRAIDQAIVTFFPAPASYTGEDVVEISTHGSPVVLQQVLRAAMKAGARLAEPGEFTLRAFLHGRIDLTQAEAVGDLVDAVTPLQARAAFDQVQGTLTRAIGTIDAALFDLAARLEASVDFPDEGYHFVDPAEIARSLDALIDQTAALLRRGSRGRLVREGHLVTLVGRPNVGKSSLFNALVGADRAIVTDTPGTTRDLVTETIDFDGLRVTLVDTAGLTHTADPIEAEGVSRALGATRVADVIVEVLDGAASDPRQNLESGLLMTANEPARVVVSNKSDAPAFRCHPETIPVSALSGAGLDRLRQEIGGRLGWDPHDSVERPEVSNIRHLDLLSRALEAMLAARAAIPENGVALSEEFVLADLQMARSAIEEISGKRTTDNVLEHIFKHFCVGK